MIRKFQKIDARRLKVNQFSHLHDMAFVFDDDEFYKHTLVDGSDVKAIICFRKYWGNNFIAFFLISDDIKPMNARELKRFIYEAADAFQAQRIQTDSQDCDTLNKWHKFLGFRLEGKREKMLYDKDFNMWCLLKGKDF